MLYRAATAGSPMSLRGSPMLMKNDGGASFSLQRRLQPTVFALTEFRRMCGEAWAVLQGSGFRTVDAK